MLFITIYDYVEIRFVGIALFASNDKDIQITYYRNITLFRLLSHQPNSTINLTPPN